MGKITLIYAGKLPRFEISTTTTPSNDIKPSKTLWNCSIEAALEFHRVVSDLFPQGQKQLRYITSDYVGKFITPGWSDNLITQKELFDALNACEAPQTGGDISSCSILNGILFALEAMTERSPKQRNDLREYLDYLDQKEEERLKLYARGPKSFDEILKEKQTKGNFGKNNFRINNKGAVVIITSLESVSEYESIIEYFTEQILAKNESIKTAIDEKMVRIDQTDLFILHVDLPGNQNNIISNKEKQYSFFNSRLFSVLPGINLITGIHRVLQDVYSLVSTTVVGIPMKEANQSGQSIHYDVELLHPKIAHSALKNSGLLEENNSKLLDNVTVHWNLFNSVRLKWCTAKALKNEIVPLICEQTYPFTLAFNKNRASICLTSFVVNGKSVMLEVIQEAFQSLIIPNVKDKLISHYLSKNEEGRLVIQLVNFEEKKAIKTEKIEEFTTQEIPQTSQASCVEQQITPKIKWASTNPRDVSVNPQEEILKTPKRPLTIEETPPSKQQQTKCQNNEELMNQRIKQRKLQIATLWQPKEELDLYDWWRSQYKTKFWANWKGEFEGRKKFGDKAQECLYPGLKLPAGQTKWTGTGNAGPIE
uniref:Protein asunder n=1 Tax=Meloidogyne incognita TaxID=6306 RepID=A0A914L8H0_MELIC